MGEACASAQLETVSHRSSGAASSLTQTPLFLAAGCSARVMHPVDRTRQTLVSAFGFSIGSTLWVKLASFLHQTGHFEEQSY